MFDVQIVTGPIDENAAARLVENPSHGAILVFRGVVRDHHDGRAVTEIDYHAYVEMALAELRRVATRARDEHGLSALVVVHRIGVVQVGETSLLVVAAAAHRRPVFEGALALIDEIKKTVPVWKKERGPDGMVWVDGVLPAPDG